MLLLNERDEVCEGTITTVFLDDGSGVLKTPPLACGLLAGVLREELLETGRATEQRLRIEDLHRHRLFRRQFAARPDPCEPGMNLPVYTPYDGSARLFTIGLGRSLGRADETAGRVQGAGAPNSRASCG